MLIAGEVGVLNVDGGGQFRVVARENGSEGGDVGRGVAVGVNSNDRDVVPRAVNQRCTVAVLNHVDGSTVALVFRAVVRCETSLKSVEKTKIWCSAMDGSPALHDTLSAPPSSSGTSAAVRLGTKDLGAG